MELSATLIISILTVLASFYAWSNNEVMSKWIFNPYTIQNHKEYHRFITSGFIHNDQIHLFFNVYVFYSFGGTVEKSFIGIFGPVVGVVAYLTLYLMGIVVSDIPTYLKHKNNVHYNALGASGGVSSVLFSFILFYPFVGIAPYGIGFLSLPGIVWGLAYLAYSYFMSKKQRDNINHDAHFFGAAFGLVFTFLIAHSYVMEALGSVL